MSHRVVFIADLVFYTTDF